MVFVKVLHVIPSVSPLRGGPSRAVLGMVRALRSAGCDAEIACTDDDGPGRLRVPLGAPIEWEGARVHFFPRFSPPIGALREFQYAAALGPWLRRCIPSHDLVHVHAIFSYASTRAMGIARRCGKPYVVRPIGQLSPWSLQQKAAKKRLYLALAERRNIAGACGVHCTSDAERRDILDFAPDLPAFVSPIGMEPPERQAGAREAVRRRFSVRDDEMVILYLGRLHPKKGIELLLDATSRLPARGFALVIAGSGEDRYEARLRERAAAPGFGGRVHFAGFVAGRDKDLLLQGSDLFVLPSEHENFGIAVLEALMAGLRVVVTPGVALEGFVRKIGAGVVVDPMPDALEAALRCLLAGNPPAEGERQRIRDAAAAAYSWDEIARGLVSVYEGILARRSI
ncbi:MAG TPA: glycosyltransferase [Verrucomicrobiae bacterium]|nr:glycosyltransferase [Verrucomicrobiae bacterium]